MALEIRLFFYWIDTIEGLYQVRTLLEIFIIIKKSILLIKKSFSSAIRLTKQKKESSNNFNCRQMSGWPRRLKKSYHLLQIEMLTDSRSTLISFV